MEELYFKYEEITLENCINNERNFDFICDGDFKDVTMTHIAEEE